VIPVRLGLQPAGINDAGYRQAEFCTASAAANACDSTTDNTDNTDGIGEHTRLACGSLRLATTSFVYSEVREGRDGCFYRKSLTTDYTDDADWGLL
jgi:hypothetical protein